jgi:RIO kinase 2
VHSFSVQHGTSCRGENGLKNPPSASNGDAVEPLETGGNLPSQDDDDNDKSADDSDDEELTRQLNKQRKKAIAAAHGRRRLVSSSRNAYKDKGKGTMNSKSQRQACKW